MKILEDALQHPFEEPMDLVFEVPAFEDEVETEIEMMLLLDRVQATRSSGA